MVDEPEASPERVTLAQLVGVNNPNVELKISTRDTPSEAQFRREEQGRDAWHERVRKTAAYLASICLLLAVAIACLWVAIFSDQAPEEKKWAMGILGTIAGAAVTTITGKSASPRE